MPDPSSPLDEQLQHLQRCAFAYFQHQTNPLNGLVLDKTEPCWPSSIAATGLALASYPVAVERGFMAKDQAMAPPQSWPTMTALERLRVRAV